jgi:hypothetical protein
MSFRKAADYGGPGRSSDGVPPRSARAGPAALAERVRDGIAALFLVLSVVTLSWAVRGESRSPEEWIPVAAILAALAVAQVTLEIWIERQMPTAATDSAPKTRPE